MACGLEKCQLTKYYGTLKEILSPRNDNRPAHTPGVGWPAWICGVAPWISSRQRELAKLLRCETCLRITLRCWLRLQWGLGGFFGFFRGMLNSLNFLHPVFILLFYVETSPCCLGSPSWATPLQRASVLFILLCFSFSSLPNTSQPLPCPRQDALLCVLWKNGVNLVWIDLGLERCSFRRLSKSPVAARRSLALQMGFIYN